MRPRISDNRRWLLGKTGQIIMGATYGQYGIDGPDDDATYPDRGVMDPDGTDVMRAPYAGVYTSEQPQSAYDGNLAYQMERGSGKLLAWYFDKRNWMEGWQLAGPGTGTLEDTGSHGHPVFPPNTQDRLHRILELCEEHDQYAIFEGLLSMLICQGGLDTGCTPWKYCSWSDYDGSDGACGGPVPVGPYHDPSEIVHNPPSSDPTSPGWYQYCLIHDLLHMLMASPQNERFLGLIFVSETETWSGPTGGNICTSAEAFAWYNAAANALRELCFAHGTSTPSWWRRISGPDISQGEPAVVNLTFFAESTGPSPGPEGWNDAAWLAAHHMTVGITDYVGNGNDYNKPTWLYDLQCGGMDVNPVPWGFGRIERAWWLGHQSSPVRPVHAACGTVVGQYPRLTIYHRNPSEPYGGQYGHICVNYCAAFDNGRVARCVYGFPASNIYGSCTPGPITDEEYAWAAAGHTAGEHQYTGPVQDDGGTTYPTYKTWDPDCTSPTKQVITQDHVKACARAFYIAPLIDGAVMSHQWSGYYPHGGLDLNSALFDTSLTARQIAQEIMARGGASATAVTRSHDKVTMTAGLTEQQCRHTGTRFTGLTADRQFAVYHFIKDNPAQVSAGFKVRVGTPGAWYFTAYRMDAGLIEMRRGQITASWNGVDYQLQFHASDAITWASYDFLLIVQNWSQSTGDDITPPVPGEFSPAPDASNAPPDTAIALTWFDTALNLATVEIAVDTATDWHGISDPNMTVEAVQDGYRFTYQPPASLGLGWHTALSRARDDSNNYAETVWTFQVQTDDEGPVPSAPTPTPDATNVDPYTMIAITFSDASGMNNTSVKLQIDGGAWIPYNDANMDQQVESDWVRTTYNYPTYLSVGLHLVSWYAEDAVGNPTTYTYSFRVPQATADITAPTLSGQPSPPSPVPDTEVPPTHYFRSDWIDPQVTGYPTTGVENNTAKLRLDGGTWHTSDEFRITNLVNGVTRFEYLGPDGITTVGPHTIEWSVSDNAGNEGTYSYSVQVVPPQAPEPPANVRVINLYFPTPALCDATLAWTPMDPGAADGIIVAKKVATDENDGADYLPGSQQVALPAAGEDCGDATCVTPDVDPEAQGVNVLGLPTNKWVFFYVAAYRSV